MRALLMMGMVMGAVSAQAGPDRHLVPEDIQQAGCLAFVPIKGDSRAFVNEKMVADVSVVVSDGRIQAVSGDLGLEVTEGQTQWRGTTCEVVDISGMTLTPGLFEPHSQLGLVEVSLEEATRDADDGGEKFGASLRVAESYNPRSTLIPIARVEGVTSAVIQPSGGRISGRAAMVDLAGSTQKEAVANGGAAVVASIAGKSRAAALAELRAVLEDARSYSRNRPAFENNSTRRYRADYRDLEALIPVLQRRVPLIVAADRAADIEALIRLGRELSVRIVISGGAEAWIVAGELAAARVPVIVDPMVYGAGGYDQTHARKDNAKLLSDAGVTVMMSTFDSHNVRLLRHVAGNAVRGGLEYDRALAAITTTPARVFGGSRRGSIAPGQVGNLVVFEGDPLELRTSVRMVLIRGQVVPLDSRQWQLFLRYREPGTVPVSALPLPE